MRITRIEAVLVKAEVAKPYVTAMDKRGMRETRCVVVRLTTDDGLVGLGEADPFVGFTAEGPESVMETIRHYLGPAVLGLDPAHIAALHLRMDAVVPGAPFAKAAIDMAAHDVQGRALGVPVYQLLGGRVRDRVPLIWPIGGGTPAENVAEAVAKMAEGYRTLHIKVGAGNPDEDVARVRAVRTALGDDIFIMVDANQAWDRSTALRMIERLQPLNLSIIEQPVPAWDTEGLALIQARTSTPISADEALTSTHQAVTLIRRQAVRAFSLKTGKCGGLFRTRQIAAIVEAAGLTCFVNSMIEMGISVAASLHLAASVPNLVGHGHALMSHLRLKEDILLPDSFQYDGREMLIPEACHGLGVAIDEAVLDRRTITRFELNL